MAQDRQGIEHPECDIAVWKACAKFEGTPTGRFVSLFNQDSRFLTDCSVTPKRPRQGVDRVRSGACRCAKFAEAYRHAVYSPHVPKVGLEPTTKSRRNLSAAEIQRLRYTSKFEIPDGPLFDVGHCLYDSYRPPVRGTA